MMSRCADCLRLLCFVNICALLSIREKFQQWESTDRTTLAVAELLIDEFINKLADIISELATHHFVAKKQGRCCRELKENLKPNECLLQGDYSQNYSMTVQDATQGMFFNVPSQATLHPFLAYINIDGKTVLRSMCVFSDFQNHDAISVNAFLKPVLMYVKSISPAVDTMKYFTDGADGQYKNCKNFANLLHHEEAFNIKYAEWNFFATSHGKGPCDGIGGTIKRLAFQHSLQGGDIQTPFALFQWCTQHVANMKMFYVSSEDVRENQTRLNPRLSKAKTLPRTQSFHRFVPSSTSKYHMNATDFSENKNFKTF